MKSVRSKQRRSRNGADGLDGWVMIKAGFAALTLTS